MNGPDTDNTLQSLPFEARLNRLQQIVATLERDEVSLEEAVNLYAEGTEAARNCLDHLKHAELKIQELTIE